MTQKSKGYEVLRWYVRFAFWLTHKRIIVTGRENIPTGKPIIFAANHQNALMDPLALVCTNPLQTLWLARADIFKSKATQPILKFMKMIPIYRIRDGKDNLTNNEQIFNQVNQVLEDNDSVALFPEAAHSGKRQMLPHKKAIPRIALDAESKSHFKLGLQIVPVGIYYDHYWNFNRTLIVNYGAPFEIDSYKERYAENPQNAMLALRDEIHDHLAPLTMQINSEKCYQDCENVRMVAGKEFATRKIFSHDPILHIFIAEQELMLKIGKLETSEPAVFDEIITQTARYISKINKAGVSDSQVVKASKSSFLLLVFQLVFAIISIPVFAFGFLFSFIPYFLPRVTLARKVKDKAFLSSFNFAMGLILFPLFYLVEASAVWIIADNFLIAITTFICMPFAGKIAYNLLLFYKDLVQALTLKLFRRKLFLQCENLRLGVLKVIEVNIIRNYKNYDDNQIQD